MSDHQADVDAIQALDVSDAAEAGSNMDTATTVDVAKRLAKMMMHWRQSSSTTHGMWALPASKIRHPAKTP